MRVEQHEIHVDYQRVGAVQIGSQPVLHAYLLDASAELLHSATRPAVIICPGGAYAYKSDREAEPIAMRFLAAGIHAFVLQYSVAPSRYPAAALELASTVQFVREHASEFGIYTDQIYIAGFSAGGHLCATLGTLWHEPVFRQALGSDDANRWKPDGMVLCYPVITMGQYTHKGSRENLLGSDATQTQWDALSLETRVSAKTVPTYLWHTIADGSVPVENALLFATALRSAAVPFEMHLYEKGVHGLSLCDETSQRGPEHLMPDNANWMEMAIHWIKRRGTRC